MLKKLLSPDGKTGLVAASLALLIAVSVANVVAFEYIEHRPVYPGDPASRMTVRSWRGLFDLEDPVDTIILGDSTAGVDLLTGPISDRLGGSVLNLSNNIGSSVLSDAWMLEYYLSIHGAPKNVILLRSCAGYEVSHSVEYMAAVPLGWGYWERLGSTPVWGDNEPRDLFIAKYAVLYSDSDTLSKSLLSLFGKKPNPYPDIRPSRFYSGGITTQSELETIRNGRPAWVYGPFSPSPDSGVALDSMSGLAERYGFQLYLCVGPEWDEAYRDPGRLAKVNSMIEYLGKFADPKYTHLINTIRVFQSDQMQNPNHLRPGAEKIYTEAIIDAIVSLKNGLAPYGETAVQLDKVTLNRNVYQVGGKPKILVSLSAPSSFGMGTLSGSVSCLVKASGTEDESWVARSSAVAFSMAFNGRSDVDLTLDIGTLENNGNYDLVVFLRQDTENLAYEGRTVLSKRVVVNPAVESIAPGQLSLSPDDWDGDKLSQPPVFDAGGVTLKNTGPAGNQGIVSAFPLGSDNFKVSIDYEAQQLPGPKDKGTRSDAIFSIRIGNQQYSLAYTTDAYGGHYRYQAWPAALAAFVSAPGKTSGRLRLRRDSTTLWAETWNNGAWVTIGSIEVPANTAAYVWLGTFSDTGQPVAVRFSNLTGE